MQTDKLNVESHTVQGFGMEWQTFDQSAVAPTELKTVFADYFKIFPWHLINQSSVGADFGCGSGRWSMFVAPQVGEMHLVDASREALEVAKRNLAPSSNVKFHCGSIEAVPIAEASLDFAFSLGVLHHLPDTARALRDIARTLKPGAPFLVYLYYAFDNRPPWFRALWRVSDRARHAISRLRFGPRKKVAATIAALVYWPLARAAGLGERARLSVDSWPLSFYRRRSFYVMKNDALDRFGTRLEKRFTKKEITDLLIQSGFERITFSNSAPYWCAVGYRK